MSVGFFGKLPGHGDFLERRMPVALLGPWDDWLQQCMDASRRELGEQWLDCYLTSPIWRFFLTQGVAGGSGYAGVLLPSVDRVGRYFPLTAVAELPPEVAPVWFAEAAADWFEGLEQVCAAAVEDPDVDLNAFDESLAASADRLAELGRFEGPPLFSGGIAQWRWPVSSTRALGSAVASPLMTAASATLRPLTMWWTEGSERVEPSVLLVRQLPRPESFSALLSGIWDSGQWKGVLEASRQPMTDWRAQDPDEGALADAEFEVISAGITDQGTVREQNQDNLLCADDRRVWVVSDGMGGHSHGELASQMVVDALNSAPLTATLDDALDVLAETLSRVNADLQRIGQRGGDRVGATIVALLIRGTRWAIAWAGDSRAYLYRSNTLRQLSRDHTVAAALAGEGIVSVVPRNEITRAVGGDNSLELEQTGETLADGDRFLLCSDGLYGALTQQRIAELLTLGTPEEATRGLIAAARAAGADDNVTVVVVDAHAVGA